ncbi:hypothetical protein [Streptomyces swartbergensis]|uniref:hypothetical protein n=1 Tax=Streptomyces swartbergensis TaxID=487165 RepID=UPI0038065158
MRVPLTVRETRLSGGASAAATWSATSRPLPITPPATTAPPTAVVVAMKVRRVVIFAYETRLIHPA